MFLFNRIWKDRIFRSIDLDLSINVASTVDTITGDVRNGLLNNTRDFGAYLLIPKNAQQSLSLNFYSYFNVEADNPFLLRLLSGFYASMIASNSVWSIDGTTIDVSAASYRIGVFHDFIPISLKEEKNYSITIGVGYTHREINGDLSFNSQAMFRESILGTQENAFSGLELSLGVRLKNLRAEVIMPNLGRKNSEVRGLTGTQFVTSITFIGGFPLSIRNDNKEPEQLR